jgi:uncharacterized membrane protein YedE/YeeE
MTDFAPLASLSGGVLIGMSVVALMLLNGRIAGISGITAGLLSLSGGAVERGWRIAFVAGLIGAPWLLSLLGHEPRIAFVTSLPAMVLSGFLVGFGTVLGNGCTSGHGVCGLARLSPRSIVATAVFMAAGVATAFVVQHVISGI